MAYLPERDGDTRIVLLDPARAARVIVLDWLHYKASPRILDQSTFEITVPHTSPVWTTQYSSATAASTYWATWSFDFYFRGVKKFSGPVCAGSIDETGAIGRDGKPIAFATLQCCSWLVWFLGGRTVQTGTGAVYAQSAQPWDNIMRDLVRVNATASYVTPPGYTGGVSRANFGPFTLAVEADTSTASNGSFKLQAGKSLLDNVAELGTLQTSTADYLWPYVEESGTPATFTFKVLVGRSGGGRQIGSDKSASITMSPAMGTVRNAKIAFDHLHVVTTACASGAKRGSARARTWVHDSSLASTFGVREDEINIPASLTADTYERTAEAYRMLADANAETTRTYSFIPNETSQMRYALDYNEKDTITAVVGSTGEVLQKLCIGADIEATAPSPSVVQLIFGRYPVNAARDAQRSGGGGRGGGRRNGGKPRDGDGQSEQDPDSILGYKQIATQNGTVDAEEANNYLDYKGRYNDAVLRVVTYGTDSAGSESSGTPDKIRDDVVVTTTATGDLAANRYAWVYDTALSRYVLMLIFDPGAGVQPSPTENT